MTKKNYYCNGCATKDKVDRLKSTSPLESKQYQRKGRNKETRKNRFCLFNFCCYQIGDVTLNKTLLLGSQISEL